MICGLYALPALFGTKLTKQSAGAQILEGWWAAAPLLDPGLWLQQPCSPVVHLHNRCLFIHYANDMRGKLGNEGRRKEKIALAYFNILFISKCCGPQRLNLRVSLHLKVCFHLSLTSFFREESLFSLCLFSFFHWSI